MLETENKLLTMDANASIMFPLNLKKKKNFLYPEHQMLTSQNRDLEYGTVVCAFYSFDESQITNTIFNIIVFSTLEYNEKAISTN